MVQAAVKPCESCKVPWAVADMRASTVFALLDLSSIARIKRYQDTEILAHDSHRVQVCLSEAVSQPQWVGGRTTLLRRSAAARLAAALLESYERQIQSVEGALRVQKLSVLK